MPYKDQDLFGTVDEALAKAKVLFDSCFDILTNFSLGKVVLIVTMGCVVL